MTSLQFVELPKSPQPPDFAAIKHASDARLETERLEALQAAQKAAADKQAAEAAQAAQIASVQATQLTQDGVSSSKLFIYMHESGNRTDAINSSSGACGLGQALPCSKLPCSLSDYACQDQFFSQYAISRYGSWAAAETFWLANSWW